MTVDHLLQWLSQYGHDAQFIIFGVLLLTGFVIIPISEDIVIIVTGVLAATVFPERTMYLFLAVFLGAYSADSIAYWLGRLLGPKISHLPWFAKTIDPKHIERVQYYYDKYGFRTLLIGRFIPFGVRNALYVTAGLGKMHYGKFLLADGIACLTTNSILFTLSYSAGRNYETILSALKTFKIAIFIVFVLAVIAFLLIRRRKGSQV